MQKKNNPKNYINPHMIYKVLEEKERNGFSDEENEPKKQSNLSRNKNSKNLSTNKNNYFLYLKRNPFDDGSFDLHKANWDVSKKNKPTAKLRSIKLGNPFATADKHKTNFGYVYSAGGIPCRIDHGSVSMKLVWSIPIESLEYDPSSKGLLFRYSEKLTLYFGFANTFEFLL